MKPLKIFLMMFVSTYSILIHAADSEFLDLNIEDITPGSTVVIKTDLHFPPNSEEPRELKYRNIKFDDVNTDSYPEVVTKSCFLQLRETFKAPTVIPKGTVYTVHSTVKKIDTVDPINRDWEDRYRMHLRDNPGRSKFLGFGEQKINIYFENSNLMISCHVLSNSTNVEDYVISSHIVNHVSVGEAIYLLGTNLLKIKESDSSQNEYIRIIH
ncbi:MAG: hypothetical protein ACXVCP_02640 [Bdellovibrio sp.]